MYYFIYHYLKWKCILFPASSTLWSLKIAHTKFKNAIANVSSLSDNSKISSSHVIVLSLFVCLIMALDKDMRQDEYWLMEDEDDDNALNAYVAAL